MSAIRRFRKSRIPAVLAAGLIMGAWSLESAACCVNMCPQCSQSSSEASSFKNGMDRVKRDILDKIDEFRRSTEKALGEQGDSVKAAAKSSFTAAAKQDTDNTKAIVRAISLLENRMQKFKNASTVSSKSSSAPATYLALCQMAGEYVAEAKTTYVQKATEGAQKARDFRGKSASEKRKALLGSPGSGRTVGGTGFTPPEPDAPVNNEGDLVEKLIIMGFDRMGVKESFIVAELIIDGDERSLSNAGEGMITNGIEGMSNEEKTFEARRKASNLRAEMSKEAIRKQLQLNENYNPLRKALERFSPVLNEEYTADLQRVAPNIDGSSPASIKRQIIYHLSMQNLLWLEELQREMSRLSLRATGVAQYLEAEEGGKLSALKNSISGGVVK